ncbi:cytoplasmic polyadenylated homeobox 1 isoform X1 [Mus musculus]|uniref:Cytoplasmic polyadenylated homeobox n=1 Tax=Mus musculus TaxID=10090 RepID=Q8BX39_MOUSE|nr:cytoplasmic polyadenylated homeobox 1 [Mus musculus]XP_017171258.1 cytoplasmic polyadenylated homeobox 1 isoform X1 [Mus musculus]XP_017171259.1 cytoplasmic polyadenylated homeobox 1 isoform X1 [Mus musculus]AAI32039.1 Cytoplasmic polyadenylated homeobox [Mus musculus]AAI32041.1 Cytoplasmic polyadenylated homeobox [Mus musculus]ABB43278.1 homeobox protein ESO1 [Mus musculus]BAC33549.1 unnamed protein product [Mus musculus]|eukprot:NP_001257435.1 predicted gene 2104 [Mus musculus]
MLSKNFPGAPETKDNRSKARKRYGSRNSKPRHKFSRDELKRLKQEFAYAPYPDFTTKDELARQFQCEVSVIDNWFQNKRARLAPELKSKISAMRRMRRCQDYMRTGHQDTQPPKASGEQYSSCDSVVRSIGRQSIGTVEHQGAAGRESSFRPTNFTFPPVYEQYYMGDQLETQETQYFTFSY